MCYVKGMTDSSLHQSERSDWTPAPQDLRRCALAAGFHIENDVLGFTTACGFMGQDPERPLRFERRLGDRFAGCEMRIDAQLVRVIGESAFVDQLKLHMRALRENHQAAVDRGEVPELTAAPMIH